MQNHLAEMDRIGVDRRNFGWNIDFQVTVPGDTQAEKRNHLTDQTGNAAIRQPRRRLGGAARSVVKEQ